MFPFVEPRLEDCRLPFKQIPGFRADDDDLYMDVWLPTSSGESDHPVAIFIHGGAFIVGSTKDVAHNQIQWLLERGVICVSIEYRLSPHATHFEQRDDLLDAYRYVVQSGLQDALRSKGQSIKVDTARIIITGGSAGGTSTIAMAMAVCALRQNGSNELPLPRAIMPAFPLVSWTDKPAFCEPRYKLKQAWSDKEDWPIIEGFLNGRGSTSQPYPQNVFQPDLTCPRTLFNTAVFATKTANSFVLGQDQPYSDQCDLLRNIPFHFPPTAIWAAVNDSLIPVEQSLLLADKLKEAGVEVRLELVQAEHGFTDLPARYFEKDAPGWWRDHIVPVLEWVMVKLDE